MELDPTRCYRALLARDARFDGRFFVAVRTTGIYCRPICPAPPPKAQNVRFYACAAAAEAAGFRPCLRCRPETAPGTPAWSGSSAVVARALRLISADALDAGDVEALAARVGIGGRQLRRLFADHLGASPAQIARARRVHFARTLLDDTDLPMGEVAYAAGFGSVRQFNEAMRGRFGEAPRRLRARRRRDGGPVAGARLVVRLPFRPPFDWPRLLRFLARRATPGVEAIVDGVYRRTIGTAERSGEIAVSRPDGARHLLMEVRHVPSDDLLAIVERARRLFDLGADPLRIARELGRHPELRRDVARRRGLRVPGAWDGFELAARAVLGQQVTVAGATTLAGRLAREPRRPVPDGTGARVGGSRVDRLAARAGGYDPRARGGRRIGTPAARCRSRPRRRGRAAHRDSGHRDVDGAVRGDARAR